MKKTSYLPVIAIALVATLFTGCAIIELIIDLLNYEYTCDGGTPRGGTTTDFKRREHCVSCDMTNFHVVNKRCVPIVYTCENGTAKNDDTPSENEDPEYCIECDPGYELDNTNNVCVAPKFIDHPKTNGAPTSNSAAITVTASVTATLWWVLYANGTAINAADTLINDAMGSGGIQRGSATDVEGGTAHGFTVSDLTESTQYDLYVAIEPDVGGDPVLSERLDFKTAAVGDPVFTMQPEPVTDSLKQTTVTIQYTSSEAGTHSWVLYNEDPGILDVGEVKVHVETPNQIDGVLQRSNGNNIPTNTNLVVMVNLAELTANSTYYFYALITDNENNQILSPRLQFTTDSYDYACANGDKADGTTATANDTNCQSCDNYFKLVGIADTGRNECVATEFFCNGGMEASGNPVESDYGDGDNKNDDVEKCISCDGDGDIVHNGICETFGFSVAPTASGATASGTTITTTASHNATLHWVVYADGTTKDSATTVYNEAQDDSTVSVAARSGSTGVALTHGESTQFFIGGSLAAETDYTAYVVITSTANATRRVLSSDIDFNTTATGIPGFSAQPAAANITQETATITLTADEMTNLYWVLAKTEQTFTAAALKTTAEGSVGGDIVAVSGSNADTESANMETSISLTGLSAKTPHFFYALLQDTDNNQTTSNQLMFETTGYPFVCNNGEEADGTNTTAGMIGCKSCNATDHIVHDGLCVAFAFDGQPTISNTMANGATITATATHDATLHWVVYVDGTTKNSATTVVEEAQDDSTVNVIARSGTAGVALTGGESKSTDITGLVASTNYELYVTITSTALKDLSTADSKVVILSESITLNTNNDGVPTFTTQPAASAIQQTTATVTLTANEPTDLYWVVYNSAQTLSAHELKDAAEGNVGGSVVAVSGSSETVVESTEKTISLMNLSPLTPYHFYALLEDSDGNQATSDERMFETTGYPFVCNNGEKADGTTTSQNTTKCASCNDFFKPDGSGGCTPTIYTCSGGDKANGSPNEADDGHIVNKNEDIENCSMCTDPGLSLNDRRCVDSDNFDGDNLGNDMDIDDDNDGLIEIATLDELYNMRFNLAGTSYRTSSVGGGNTDGAPDTGNKANNYVCGSGATGTCGYELVADINFDSDGENDGTWEKTDTNTYELDDDDDRPYFSTTGTFGGWTPVGNTNPMDLTDYDDYFNAFFEGNGNTISGLAIIDNNNNFGLFGAVANGSTIRNLTIKDSLVVLNISEPGIAYASGILAGILGDDTSAPAVSIDSVHITGTSEVAGDNNDQSRIGGLAGNVVAATISNSSSSASVDNGLGDAGGLIGYLTDGSITASFATGDVKGGGGGDKLGGLVGQQQNGTITDSYATGAVSGVGDNSTVGGLVGDKQNGTITSSYATGSVIGGNTVGTHNVGGLVGVNNGGDIIASYTTGMGGATVAGQSTSNVGGLVGLHTTGTIRASYSTAAVSGDGGSDNVGGLVGHLDFSGAIIASFAPSGSSLNGAAGNSDNVGGLVGFLKGDATVTASFSGKLADGGSGNNDAVGGLIGRVAGSGSSAVIASYATGVARGGQDDNDYVGGLIGYYTGSTVVRDSYATGNIDGDHPFDTMGTGDSGGSLIGFIASGSTSISASYGFGDTDRIENTGSKIDRVLNTGATDPSSANQLTANHFSSTVATNAWQYLGTPRLQYADYDGNGNNYTCTDVMLGLVDDGTNNVSNVSLSCNPPTLLPRQ